MTKIETEDQLREIYPAARGRAVTKVIHQFEKHSRRFIELSPFMVMSTQGSDGIADITPKGDHPGFVQVLDDMTLAIPDRPGNNRLDNLTNILSNPAVGLIFFIPGVDETLRVHGRAEISADPTLCDRFRVQDKTPKTVLLITIQEAYLHCAKALMRSKLWDPDSRIDRANLPTIGEMIRDHTGDDTPLESQEEMATRYQKTLY